MNECARESVSNYFKSDTHFNEVYPISIQLLARRHWTPIHIVRLATEFLTTGSGDKILDIGSGAGKFCLTGAYYAPKAQFFGIEQRQSLFNHARRAQKRLEIANVNFINGNFTRLNFREFDHFYFFNSFYENLDEYGRIDNTIDYSEALYEYYVRYLYDRLQEMPAGTKIATYHALSGGVPPNYELIQSLDNDDLKFWTKK